MIETMTQNTRRDTEVRTVSEQAITRVAAAAAAVTTAVPAVGTPEFRAWATALGHELADLGTGRVNAQLRALARRAREHRLEPVCAAVLADRSEPQVARCRAFYRVVTALGAPAMAASDDALGVIA